MIKLTLSTFESALQAEFGDGSTSLDELLWTARDEDAGYCLSCGAFAYGVEPDARRYACEVCGQETVYGIEEVSLMLI